MTTLPVTTTSIMPGERGKWQVFVHYPFDRETDRANVCRFCGAFRWLWLAHLVGWWNHRQISRRFA